MLKKYFKTWSHSTKEKNLQIKIQSKCFEELKKTDLYRQQKKYRWLRFSVVFFSFLFYACCYLSIYEFPVSEINGFLGSHISKDSYQMIVMTYLLVIIIFAEFVVVLTDGRLKFNREFSSILKFGLFGGINLFFLIFAFIIQPEYCFSTLGLFSVRVVIQKLMELQREAVFLSYEEAEKEGYIGHYNRCGILFEMKDEPRIYRVDYFQEENKK